MYNIIKMFTTKFGLLFFCLILKDLSAKKLEEIFTCINETECDELIQKDMSEKNSSSTTESIYNISSSANNSIYPTQTTKIKTMPDTQTPYRIKYSNELRNQSIQRVLTPICECDLTLSSCDINCCCDKDCNDFHLSAFSHCENYQAELFDKRYCYNRNFIQRNNTPFILEKLANNLFCILYDNLPPTYSVNNDLDIKTEHDLKEAITPYRLKWKWKDLLHVPEYNISSSYQDDDIVWTLHNNRIQPFEMLQSGFTELCSFKKTVKYLREWKNQCLQAELNTTNKFLFPATFNNFTIIASLYLLNETDTEVLDQVCPRNVCLTLTTYYCKHSWKKCNNSTVLGSCTNGVCYNIVKGVKYVIIHNGSMGIHSVDVYFSMGNVSSSFYQHFEVSYEWADLDKEKSFSLSGNPGYIIGKPIIIGIIKVNKTNNVDTKYISFNKTNSFLTLPVATQSGECNKIDRYTLGFGEDVKLKCSIFINTNNFSTESCVALQNLTMQLLMGDTLFNVTQTDQYGIYVSRSGNFSTNDTANWTQILLDRIPQSAIIGESVNGRLRCSGLITSIHIYVLYSVLAKPETLSNHNILGVGFTFSVESNITWPKCSLENCIDILALDVTSYVTFYDVSKPSRYFFVGGPNLDVTLPHDFFYPFLSHSVCIKSNIFFITVALSVALHKFY